MKPTIKKVIILSLAAVVIAVPVLFGWQWWQKNSLKSPVSEELQTEKNKSDFISDEEIIKKAKEEKDISVCFNIKDEQIKLLCQEQAKNQAYFTQARAQFKNDFCALIENDDSLKASCQAMVSSGITYLKKQDPVYLANIYTRNNDYDQAIEILSASEKVKSDVGLMLALALNYAGKGLMEHKEAEYIPKAETLVDNAITLNPDSAEAYRVQGYVYEVKPDLLKSIASYDKSLGKDPNYILSLVGRGHGYNLMGDLNKALEDFQKAAELDKEKQYMAIYANLCRLQTTRDDLLADGIKNCQIVIATNAVGAELKSDAYQILAETYLREEKFDEALAQLIDARIVSPQNVNLFVSFANLYNEKADYTKAIDQAKKALNIDPLKTTAYWALAYAYLKTPDYAQAERQALKGLEIISSDPSLLISNKPYFIKQLNYILADTFAAKGDKEKEAQYKAAGDSAMKTPE